MPKDRQVRVFVQICREFLGLAAGVSGQRVHDHRIGLAVGGVHRGVQLEQPPIPISFFLARKALLLGSRHVQNVCVMNARFELAKDFDLVSRCLQAIGNGFRRSQLRRRYQSVVHVVVQRQELAQRVHGAAVLQVADQCDSQSVDRLVARRHFLANRVQVQQGLARVLIGTVTAVNHRYPAGLGKLLHRTGFRVSHDDDIAVTGQHPGRVVQRFALGQGRCFDLCGFADLTAEQVEGAAEGHPGPRARLEKHVGENGALQHPGHSGPGRKGCHDVGGRENLFYGWPVELVDRQNMLAGKIHCVFSVLGRRI